MFFFYVFVIYEKPLFGTIDYDELFLAESGISNLICKWFISSVAIIAYIYG